MAYFFPHIDNFWHAQGVFTLVERRMPLYIVFLCKYFFSDEATAEFECISLQTRYSTITPRGPCPR